MAQIIKHRRGSLESLSAVTSSLQKGELVIASGSSNLSVTNGASIVFTVPENGQVQAVNRFLMGNSAPATFAASTYNGMVNGVPFYDSGSGTLYLLGSDGNTAINLVGNIQPFSSSVASSINALSSSIGTGTIGTSVSLLNTFSGSAEVRLDNLESFSGSQLTQNSALASTTASLLISTNSASVAVANLNTFSSSQLTQNSDLATYTGSVETRLSTLASTTASLLISTNSSSVAVSNLNTFTSSFSQSVATSFSASEASVTALSASVASVTGDFSSSVATSFSSSNAARVALSQSVSASFANVAGEQSAQDDRLGALEAETGSYARIDGANVFNGTQTITGSLYITQDLVVYGSSSLFDVTASRLDLGDNTIVLNTATPAVRFAGIDVIDSGSSQGTGSLYWDSLNNNWLYVQPSGSSEGYNSAILIAGPMNTGSLGNEIGITTGYIPVAVGENHIGDSNITKSGSVITIDGSLKVTGEISGSTIAGLGNAAAFSQSVDSRLDSVESSLGSGGSIGTRVSALETSSANVNDFTSSQLTQNSDLATYTGSIETRLSSLASTTASLLISTNSASVAVSNLNSFSSSQLTQNSDLATYTGSIETRMSALASTTASLLISTNSSSVAVSNLNTFSASVNTSVSSLNTFSSSTLGRLTELESKSASVDISVSNINSFTASFSESVATSFSASAASVTSLSASVASVTGDFSSSVATSFSQSSHNLNQLSSSVATTIANLDSAGFATDSELTSLSSSVATSFSASAASDAGLSARITTLEGTGSIQGLGTGNNVTFAKVTTSGDVIVGGDLVVQGNTVTLNTAQLVVEDKIITLASGSTSNATADGAGFEIAGTSASFKYDGTKNQFSSSIDIVANTTGSVNLGSAAGNSKRIAFRNTNGNLDLVPTASVAGDLLQWNGSDFVMSNTIDGGSF